MLRHSFSIEGATEIGKHLGLTSRQTHDALRRAIRGESVALMERIKAKMPFETGRARAGWGQWRRRDLEYYSPTQKRIAFPKEAGKIVIPVRPGPGLHGRSSQHSQEYYLKQHAASGPHDAVWIDRTKGAYGHASKTLELIQGTHLAYVEDLNQGSSVQAPAGFIDIEYLKAKRVFPRAIESELNKVLGTWLSHGTTVR